MSGNVFRLVFALKTIAVSTVQSTPIIGLVVRPLSSSVPSRIKAKPNPCFTNNCVS